MENIIYGGLAVALGGMIALNIQHIFRFVSEHVLNRLFYSIKIDDSSPFYYAVQKYVNNERGHKVKNFYYKNFWDNW